MAFINQTGIIGSLVTAMTVNITGNEFLTYFLIIIFLGFMALILFKMPLELGLIFLFPVVMVIAIQMSSFIPVLGVLILYFSLFFVKKYNLN